MSFKLVIFAVAVLASQADGQILRPFIAGYANGFAEVAKPFVQIGRNVMGPAADYFSSLRPQRPQVQWMIYPNQRPQGQPAFEGYEPLPSNYPNRPSIMQIFRPRPFNPQIYPLPSQEQMVIPPRPHPVPVPAPAPAPASGGSSSSSSSSEESQESGESLAPTNLLPEENLVPLPPKAPEVPKVPEVPEVPEVPVPSTLDIKDVPQTLPLEEDEQ